MKKLTLLAALALPGVALAGSPYPNQHFNNVTTDGAVSAGSATLGTPLPLSSGGLGSTTASGARVNLGAAASGANGDITSLSGLTTAVGVSEGGTGAKTASGALTALGAAPVVSPGFGGVPTAPTAAPLNNSYQLATTGYTDSAVGVEKTRAQGAESTLTASTAAAQSTANAALPTATISAYLDYPFDSIPNVAHIGGACRFIGSYRGPILNVYRENDGATQDFYAPFGQLHGCVPSSQIATWANGSPVFADILYDQVAGGSLYLQPNLTDMPLIDLTGSYASLKFDGLTTWMNGLTALASYTNGASAMSVVALAANTSTQATERELSFMTGGTGSNRATLEYGPSGNDVIAGRTLDADALERSTGFSASSTWNTEIGIWNWTAGTMTHLRNGTSETQALASSGTVSATSSTVVALGNTGASGSYYQGSILGIAFVSRALTPLEMGNLSTWMSAYPVTTPTQAFLSWSSSQAYNALTVPAAPNETSTEVLAPTGATPVITNIATLQYHHHNRIAHDASGNIWIASSSGLEMEDTSGEMSTVMELPSGSSTWSAPLVAVPSQSAPSNSTGPTYRIVQPNSFQTYNGNLYLISEVAEATENGISVGLATIAVQCLPNGTLGAPFQISPTAYTPISGFPSYTYDSVNGPPLLALANLTGTWTGSAPGQPPSDFVGYYIDGINNNILLTEKTTFPIDSTGLNYERLWRKTQYTGSAYFWWAQISHDGGNTWTTPTVTNIPNNPSAAQAIRLADGRIAMVGNYYGNTGVYRSPLYIAIYGTNGAMQAIFSVATSTTPYPAYGNTTGLAGGPQYPGIMQDAQGNIWISYDTQRQDVWVTEIPLAGL